MTLHPCCRYDEQHRAFVVDLHFQPEEELMSSTILRKVIALLLVIFVVLPLIFTKP
jgi:hypothetical protein